MERTHLRVFLAVARTGSFTKAADVAHMTQPGISQHIQSLEQELGTLLFDRSNRKKVCLTPEGEVFKAFAGRLMEDWTSLPSRFKEECGIAQRGRVRIATHNSVMVHLLPDVIRRFKKKYPDCELSIVNRSRTEILQMLKDNETDIGITSLSTVPDYTDYRVFAQFKRVLIAPKGHPLSKKKSVHPEDIAQYPLLVPPRGSNTRAIIDRIFQEKGLQSKVAMEITGREPVKAYVQMGLGISVINEYYLSGEDRKGLFVADMSRYFGKAERGILARNNKYFSNHVRDFINILIGKRI